MLFKLKESKLKIGISKNLSIWAVDILFRKNLNSYNWKFIAYHQLETPDGAAGGRTITVFGDRWCAAVPRPETSVLHTNKQATKIASSNPKYDLNEVKHN